MDFNTKNQLRLSYTHQSQHTFSKCDNKEKRVARWGDGNLKEMNVKDRDSEWPMQKDFTKESTWILFP